MFVQIIEGKASSADALRAAGEAWDQQVKPVAEGYLGSTGGVTSDGTAILIARFTDRAAAEANNDRPEQRAWFEAHQGMYDGEPTFTESDDVAELFGGGSDEAGFVQVMQGRVLDREGLEAMEAQMLDRLRELRPDLLGGIRIHHDGDRYTEVAYFTSEAEARANEARMAEEMSREEGMEDVASVDRFLDLTDPHLG